MSITFLKVNKLHEMTTRINITAGRFNIILNDGLDIKFSQVSLTWPTVVQLVFSLTLACSEGLAKSTLSLFRHSDRFDFVFTLRCID